MFRSKAVLKAQKGASLVEYALLVALIALICIPAIHILGTKSSEQFSCTAQSLNGDSSCAGGGAAAPADPPPGPDPGGGGSS